MIIAILAFIGGALTVLSPCTLPVLPFVFARADRPFARSTLPLLLGLTLTFAAVATLAAVGGGWAVRLNRDARVAALVVLGLFGLALLSSRVADWLARPALALGNRLLQRQGAGAAAETSQSLLIGVATGLLWAPCAGPILGLILTGAALSGPGIGTSLLLLAYAAGAALALGLAVFAGRRVYGAMRRSLGVASALRRAAGVAILVAVVAIALGWDSGVLTRWSSGSTQRLEQALLTALPVRATSAPPAAPSADLLGALQGATGWINSAPRTAASLRGKVVLIDFWTYSCINCLRTLPYLERWYERYRDDGLVIVGVHTPEFAFEKDPDNVRRAVAELGIRYPVAVDSGYAIWKAFGNGFWPEHYLLDADGRMRERHVGEGGYPETEQQIRTLLQQAGRSALPPLTSENGAAGALAASDAADVASPETYLGYARAERFSSSQPLLHDQLGDYPPPPPPLALNHWSLQGRWRVGPENAQLDAAGGRIVFRFHARDLHLVLSPGSNHRPVRFQVSIDGEAPALSHGSDVDANGNGVVSEQRLYQLIRQDGAVSDHVFSIRFLDPGVSAYAFTFG